MDIRAVWERIAPVTREQDARLLSASLARPAVLAWICEGSSSMRDVACGNLKTDPLHRPIMGIDNFALSIAGVENTHFEKRAWIIEIGATEHFQSFQKAGEAFMGATGPSGPGGVYFPPPPVDQDKWGPAWQGVSKALGITPWFSENRRGMSVVLVKGLAPGELVYLDMPWQVGTGAVADSWGNARIEAWYVGETELMIGGEKRKVTLTPDSWEGTTRKERAITVTK